MSRTKTAFTVSIFALTLLGWVFLGWRLLIASGAISEPLETTWRGLARRHAWAHWVTTNGSPVIRDGRAIIKSGERFEIAVQPIAVCPRLRIIPTSTGTLDFSSRDTTATQTATEDFNTVMLPRTFDGYHFFLTANNDQTLTALTFRCHP